MNNFWCGKESGHFFDIDEWNRLFQLSNKMGLKDHERLEDKLEERCKNQCVECACIVGKRQAETKKLLSK